MSQVVTAPSQQTNESATPESKSGSVTLILFAAFVLLAAHLPQLIRLGANMWAKEHYQFFPMVIVGAAYLFWVRRDLYLERSVPGKGIGVILWGFTFLQFAGGVLLDSPWLVGSSAMFCQASGMYFIGGR